MAKSYKYFLLYAFIKDGKASRANCTVDFPKPILENSDTRKIETDLCAQLKCEKLLLENIVKLN
jgi:hypothetical protein